MKNFFGYSGETLYIKELFSPARKEVEKFNFAQELMLGDLEDAASKLKGISASTNKLGYGDALEHFKKLEKAALTAGLTTSDLIDILVDYGYMEAALDSKMRASAVVERIKALGEIDGQAWTTDRIEKLEESLVGFAEKFGVTVEYVKDNIEHLGNISITGTLNSSLEAVSAKFENLLSIIEDLQDGLLTTKSFDLITKEFPELLQYMGNSQELLNKLKEKMGTRSLYDQASMRGSLYTSSDFYKSSMFFGGTENKRLYNNYDFALGEISELPEEIIKDGISKDESKAFSDAFYRSIKVVNEDGKTNSEELIKYYNANADEKFKTDPGNKNLSTEDAARKFVEERAEELSYLINNLDNIDKRATDLISETYGMIKQNGLMELEKNTYIQGIEYMNGQIDKQIKKTP